MDNIKVDELLSKIKGNENLFGKVVKLLSEMKGTQNLADNFDYLIWSSSFEVNMLRTPIISFQ